ncbi:MAG TPA: translocation/assembly module TamB domain-containing protein [Polyangiaceae bacterium]|jgi:translocation and assembly module TamB
MRKLARAVLYGIFSALVFALAAFAGVVVHFHLPVVRETIASELNRAFASAFAGTVRVEGLESIGASGVRARALVADDPDGVRVLRASGIELDASVAEIARAALFGGPTTVHRARVHDANVSLDDDARGLRIARAFAPRKPSSGGQSTLELDVLHVAIDHAWVHGAPAGQTIDADVRGLGGEIVVSRGDLGIDLAGADVDARSLPRGAELAGHVAARLESTSELRLVGRFSGEAAGIELHAAARADGERFAANAIASGASPARIRALVPGAPIHEGVSADALLEGTARAVAFRATGALGPASLDATGTWSPNRLHADARAEHLDVRAFAPALRPSDAGATATVDVHGDVASLHGTLDPPGGHATFVADLDPHALDATIAADVRNARAVFAPLFQTSKLAGHGTVHARAHLDRDRNLLGAEADARFDDAKYGPASAGGLQLRASANGPLASPAFDVDVTADRTVVPKVHVDSAAVHARGTLRDARVAVHLGGSAPFDVTARASVDPAGAVAIDDLDVRNDGTSILRGAVGWNRGALHVRLVGSHIDLARVRSTLGFEPALGGMLGLDVDATLDGKSITGRATVDARGLAYDRIEHVDALASLSSESGAYAIAFRARTPRYGWLSVESADLHLDGPALDRASWERATGTVSVDGTLRVAELAAFAKRDLPIDGWARVGLIAQRRSTAGPPDLRVSVASSDLAIGRKSWPLALDARAHLDAGGALDAHLDVAHRAEHGKLDLTTTLAWNDLVAGRLPDLATLPFTADLDVPAFDTGEACRDFGAHCRGTVAAAVHAVGPLDRGHGTVAVTLAGFRANVSPIAELADASIVGSFDRQGGKAHVTVSHYGSSARELDAIATLQVPADPRAWSASVDARFDGLPVRVPPSNASTPMYANLSGTATIRDYHRDARARIDLRADDVAWSDVKTDRVTVAGELDGRALSLSATLRAKASSASARVTAPAVWGAALAPSLASGAPLQFALRADDLRLELLEPLLPLSVGSISGRLDADASGSLAISPMRVTARGWAKVADAKIESSTVGTIQNLAATIDMRPDGTIQLENAHFNGTRGKVALNGKALAPGGVLRSIDLGASIDRADPFPLVVSGQRVGDVYGKIEATAKPAGAGFDVKLGVPSLHVQLPDVSHGTPEALDVSKNITIGVRKNGALVPVELAPPSAPPGNPIPIRVEVALGDVHVARDDNLAVTLHGDPVVEMGRDTRVIGNVDVSHGMIDIEGKRFSLEHGVVTFDGDPSNPLLAVTATWTASDRTKVFARYSGRASEGKLELSSDPPHTKDEIVALLVFGSTGGPAAGSGGTTGAVAAATAVGGASFATQPFNKALEQLTHVDIKTRVDTSGSAAKSEVEVQIAKHIWAQIAYVLGLPPPGTEPDRTWLTLAWYATARWSFDFTVGDHGSTIVDALWERRY